MTPSLPIEAATGGVTAPRGFTAGAVHCGIKATPGALDLALLAADSTASAAALFTTNLAQAAPVTVSREHLERTGGAARAVVVNSGCANACTGVQGMTDARAMAARTASALGCSAEQVLVASTGVIGVSLKMDRVVEGIAAAAGRMGRGNGSAASRAIMTTDPFPKEHAVSVRTDGGTFLVGGMAKGSGMIGPNMAPSATMLGFVTTDAAVGAPMLERALVEVVDQTFNAITVDGDTSTNDAVMMLASGASGVAIGEAEYPAFVQALRAVCLELSLGIVRGGEGATKLVTVTVSEAASAADARRCATAIANSLLVKTAIHGGDPNWGRLLAVAGRAGVAFNEARATVTIGSVVLFANGRPYDDRAPQAAAHLTATDVSVGVGLGAGSASSTVWTCDLSAEYVKINADYRT